MALVNGVSGATGRQPAPARRGAANSKKLWPQHVRVRKSRPKYLQTIAAMAGDRAKRTIYRTVQALAGPARNVGITAQLILLAGCQDNQFSQDGDVNGAFTEALLRVWDNGKFSGDYRTFLRQIANLVPPDQTPNFFTIGSPDGAFLGQKPSQWLRPTAAAHPRPAARPARAARPAVLPRGQPSGRVRAVQPCPHLQERLNVYDYRCTVDGSFGPATAAVVRQFQRDHDLTADDVVGSTTWSYLDSDPNADQGDTGDSSSGGSSWGDTDGDDPGGTWSDTGAGTDGGEGQEISRPTLRRGDRGEDVRYLQQRLSDLGYWLTVDGTAEVPNRPSAPSRTASR